MKVLGAVDWAALYLAVSPGPLKRWPVIIHLISLCGRAAEGRPKFISTEICPKRMHNL